MQRRSRKRPVHFGVMLFAIVAAAPSALAQTAKAPSTTNPSDPYTLNVAVDEVSVTFHAADFHGIPMDDLKLNDLRILDNRKKPRQIVSFEAYQNLPVRIGILMDTSRSMSGYVRRNQAIAIEYLEHLFHQESDHAFLMRFDSQTKVLQDWTGDSNTLTSGLRKVADDSASRLGGTVLFDSIYKACRDQFGVSPMAPIGNFIMLFSDGMDNASHARLEDDIDMCQKANTPIYVFSNEPASLFSDGHKTLRALATQSGGATFFDLTQENIWSDLRVIDANLRSQYRLVYKPAKLKRDGSFHRIKLDSPTRGGVLTTRSGYYAMR
jgi:Ca-activated chloride channel homolog